LHHYTAEKSGLTNSVTNRVSTLNKLTKLYKVMNYLFTLWNLSPNRKVISTMLKIMKLTAFILLITYMQISAAGYSQNVTLSLKNVPLQKVFKEINHQTGIQFFYRDALLNEAGLVSIEVKNTPLENVLNQCLGNLPVAFSIVDRTIIIKPKAFKPLDMNTIEVAPPINVTGLVIDDKTGEPLVGATIKIEGTSFGVITDINGKFTLKIPKQDVVLVISYLGYDEQRIPLKGKLVLNIRLVPSLSKLDEVVVVGYGIQKKESVVAAITTVRMADLKTAAPRSIGNMMAGQIAGIIAVQRSGEPGKDDAQFWIRGISTFGAGSTPLVLVDGVERSLSNVVPDDIENFSVLKDAAATSIYGIRGANGVILITTRRGNNGAPKISIKYEKGFQNGTSMPKFLDSPTYLELLNEARLADNPFYVTPYTPDIIAKYRSGVDPIVYPNVDWIKLMMNNFSTTQKATANISGGTDKIKYFISGSYYNENGIWKTDPQNDYDPSVKLNRFNFRSNFDIEIRKDLQLSVGLGGYLMMSNGVGKYSDSQGIWNLIMLATPAKYAATAPDPSDPRRHVYLNSGGSGNFNPYMELTDTGYRNTWENTLQTDISLNYDAAAITKGLSAGIRFSYDAYSQSSVLRVRSDDRWVLHNNPYRDSVTNKLNLLKDFPGSQVLSYNNPAGGNRQVYVQANLNYVKKIGDHSLSGLLLFNMQDYQNGAASDATGALPFRYTGLASRLTYSYMSKYIIEANAGYNGSENFASGKRFGLFPSVALGWIISEEPFFKNNINPNFVNFLKFRGSYGVKGNDVVGGRRFSYLTTLGGGLGSYPLGTNVNVNWGGIGEDQWGADLTWEKEHETNLGIEVRFLKGFYLQADLFQRKRDGIFTQRNSLPAIVGTLNNPWGNIGKFENSGVDMSLEYRRRIGKLDVSLRGNYTFARNKLIDNDQPDYTYIYQNRRGKRLNQPFGLIAEGLFTSQEEINSAPQQTFGRVRVGDIKYKDINQDGKIDTYDEVAIGNPNTPEAVYGFGFSLAYHSFDLSVFFQGAGNMSFMLGGTGFFPFQQGESQGNVNQWAIDRWTPQNPSQNVLFPRLSEGDNTNNYRSSTWWQRSADYLRLKTTEVGYTLPKKISSKIKIASVRFYISGLNLFTFSSFKYWDPELGNGNGAKYPIQKVCTIGVNVNF